MQIVLGILLVLSTPFLVVLVFYMLYCFIAGIFESADVVESYVKKQFKKGKQAKSLTPLYLIVYFIILYMTFPIWHFANAAKEMNNTYNKK
jgi:membrane-anchored glycerophosphoryl diester phosphodiesterase (GDPDase)